jgi:hypothetical protein
MPLDFTVKEIQGGGESVLFVLGYGNDFDNPGIKWLRSWIRRTDLNVTMVRIPTRISDWRSEIIDPLKEISERREYRNIISHSFGSLATYFIDAPGRRIFISPFWGIPGKRANPFLIKIVKFMGNSKIRMIPRGFDLDDLGDLAQKDDILTVPRFLSFANINGIIKLTEILPPPKKGDIVFISRDDSIIDLKAVTDCGMEVRYYRGGHQPFVISGREDLFQEIYDLISTA